MKILFNRHCFCKMSKMPHHSVVVRFLGTGFVGMRQVVGEFLVLDVLMETALAVQDLKNHDFMNLSDKENDSVPQTGRLDCRDSTRDSEPRPDCHRNRISRSLEIKTRIKQAQVRFPMDLKYPKFENLILHSNEQCISNYIFLRRKRLPLSTSGVMLIDSSGRILSNSFCWP